MNFLKKYYKPTSLTWWTSIGAIGYGIFNKSIESILAGLGGIGIRGALPTK